MFSMLDCKVESEVEYYPSDDLEALTDGLEVGTSLIESRGLCKNQPPCFIGLHEITAPSYSS